MKKKQKKQPSRARRLVKTIAQALLVCVLVIVMVAANILLPSNSRIVNCMLGYKQSVNNSKVNTEGINLNYNEADFDSKTIGDAEVSLGEKIAGEGIVLMKNETNTMPFEKGTKFSFFSANCTDFSAGGMMGNSMNLKDSFEAGGFGVNEKLWKFYSKGKGSNYGLAKGSISFGDSEDFSINECPLSKIQSEDGLTDSFAGTTAVYVMKRVGGEGRDLPRSMYNHTDVLEDQAKNYLEPDSVELEILKYLNDNFKDVVILMNMNYAMELDWVKQFPNIHAIVLSPPMGKNGLTSLVDIFAGTINPSGKTVDTYAADSLGSPAVQNFGDYQYYTADGKQTKYNYVSYKEGIYVGYKYYETRYEDVVLGQGNAGDYDYASEICYPFGYGLSYTSFDWSNYQTNWNGTTCTVSIDVTNTGKVAGKDVVEIYAQSPYTEYDKANKIEKSSVELVGYGKTNELAAGETETITITFDQEQLKSYDYTTAKTYILDAGDYYITAATDAHLAINNILSAKGKGTSDGMTAEGNKALVSVYTPSNTEVDSVIYSKDSYSGFDITNQFDEANDGLTYLSRKDWAGTFPTHDGKLTDQISTWGNEMNGTDEKGNPASYLYYKTISAENLAKLDSFESKNPVDPATLTDQIVFGADNGLQLIDMRGLDYNDKLWEDLLDELTPEDYQIMIAQSGYGTVPLKSIDKPFCIDADTAVGLIYGGTGAAYPSTIVLAMTWNQEIAKEYGAMIGNEAIIGGAAGWYAPSMNIHRTPFSGRNGEYYSEDGFLSGIVGAYSTYGAASKGMYTYIKHFAFNEQENHRGDRDGQYSIATFLNEQSAREIYLKPFEMCMKVGDVTLNYVKEKADGTYENASREIRASQALMTAFNRIGYTWTGATYSLLTGILRNEWGFNGFVITDNANTGVYMDGYQMLEAGGDGKLTSIPEGARYKFDETSVAEYHYGREAMHHMLYTVVNSKAMNGAMPGSTFKQGLQMSQIILIALNLICIVIILLIVLSWIRRFRNRKTLEIINEE